MGLFIHGLDHPLIYGFKIMVSWECRGINQLKSFSQITRISRRKKERKKEIRSKEKLKKREIEIKRKNILSSMTVKYYH